MSLTLSDAVSILSKYDSAQKSAANTLISQQNSLKTQTNTLNSLIASGASQAAIAAQAAVVNDLQTQIGNTTSYLRTLKQSQQNAQTVLLTSNSVTGATGPVSNPLVGVTGPVGPTGPTGAPWLVTLDSTPVQGSSNPVTSGGVYTAIQSLNTSKSSIAAGTKVGDPNVQLLCHFNGTNGSTTIVDSSSYNRTLTSNGAITLTTTYKKFGSSSLLLNGVSGSVTGPYINIPSGTSFSIEFWYYPTNLLNVNMPIIYIGSSYFYINPGSVGTLIYAGLAGSTN